MYPSFLYLPQLLVINVAAILRLEVVLYEVAL